MVCSYRIDHLSGVRAVLLVLLALSFLPSAVAQTQKATLHGEVEEHNRVTRLPRPKMPTLTGAADASLVKGKIDGLLSTLDSQPAAFKASLKTQTPKLDRVGCVTCPKSKPLTGIDSTADMLIHWERWHQRVSSVIFDYWMKNNTIVGRAKAIIHVTRDNHVSVQVQDVLLDAGYNFPPDNISLRQKMAGKFKQEVVTTVTALDGSAVLDFPEGSERNEVVLSPNFVGGNEASYDWRKDDEERVRMR